MGQLDDIYTKLPVWAQHWAATGYGLYRKWLRFGPGYADFVNGYKDREFFSIEQFEALQTQKLQEILKIAVMNVPFYQDSWSSQQKMAALDGCLDRLPLLEKDPIRQNPTSFLRKDLHPIHVSTFHTSGSTGTPVKTFWTTKEIRDSRALREARSANWANVSFSMARATFSGRLVVPDTQSDGPFYRFNLAERQVYFSAFHLRPDTARSYVEALHRHKIAWLTGYAVSFYLLARHIINQNIDVPELKAVITTSEKVTEEMRKIMEQAYRCPIFEEYSSVETAIFASECEKGRLHISPDAGIVEIIRPDGTPCAPGEVGEVVTTSFLRKYQPFIRYRLGDLASWDNTPCPCGRNMPVIKEVVGRTEDVVVGPDGREMVRFHGIFTDQPNIIEAQVVQETLNMIRVKVVPGEQFSSADTNNIQYRVRQRLGEVNVVVETVKEIPLSKSGKFKAVVSLLRK